MSRIWLTTLKWRVRFSRILLCTNKKWQIFPPVWHYTKEKRHIFPTHLTLQPMSIVRFSRPSDTTLKRNVRFFPPTWLCTNKKWQIFPPFWQYLYTKEKREIFPSVWLCTNKKWQISRQSDTTLKRRVSFSRILLCINKKWQIFPPVWQYSKAKRQIFPSGWLCTDEKHQIFPHVWCCTYRRSVRFFPPPWLFLPFISPKRRTYI